MNQNLEVAYIATTDVIPYANNPRTHSEQQVAQVAASIKEFGFNNPILLDEHNGIIAGHGRLAAAQKLGMELVPTITLAGLTEAQRKAYVIADNKLTENGGWDTDILAGEVDRLKELNFDLDILALDDDLISAIKLDESISGDSDNPYTQKVEIPVYEPTGPKPELESLYDATKAIELCAAITKSALPNDEKVFLLAAANRHVVLNFEQIANYYANSSAECQELMEDSALVIIDFDKAIENGYVALSDKISHQYLVDYPDEA